MLLIRSTIGVDKDFFMERVLDLVLVDDLDLDLVLVDDLDLDLDLVLVDDLGFLLTLYVICVFRRLCFFLGVRVYNFLILLSLTDNGKINSSSGNGLDILLSISSLIILGFLGCNSGVGNSGVGNSGVGNSIK